MTFAKRPNSYKGIWRFYTLVVRFLITRIQQAFIRKKAGIGTEAVLLIRYHWGHVCLQYCSPGGLFEAEARGTLHSEYGGTFSIILPRKF